jgi:hypothetical protein
VIRTLPEGQRCSTMSSARENASIYGAVTRLSGGDVNVSRYILGAGDVRANTPPVLTGRENRGLEGDIGTGGEYSDFLYFDDKR